MNKLKVRVTKADIKYGKRCDRRECPIGYAIARRLIKIQTRGWHSSIWKNAVTMYSPYEYGFDSWLPKKAMLFIKAFDAGQEVKPFSFNLVVAPDFFYERT